MLKALLVALIAVFVGFLPLVVAPHPAAAAPLAQESPPPEGPPPGVNLDGLGRIVSDAFSNALASAMENFWSNVALRVPALIVGTFFDFVARIARWLYESLSD